jgi:hypothetical protein
VQLSPWPVPAGSQWLDHVNQPQTELELGTLRHSSNTGRPFGTNDWVNATAKTLGLESTLRSRPRRR